MIIIQTSIIETDTGIELQCLTIQVGGMTKAELLMGQKVADVVSAVTPAQVGLSTGESVTTIVERDIPSLGE